MGSSARLHTALTIHVPIVPVVYMGRDEMFTLIVMIHSHKSTSNSLPADTVTHRGAKFRLLAYMYINYSLVGSMDERTKKTPIPKCRLYSCYCFRWCSTFVGSESGQKQSVKLLQEMVYNTIPPTATHCLYILYIYFGKGGGGWGRSERR
jgi:hypothetical protein